MTDAEKVIARDAFKAGFKEGQKSVHTRHKRQFISGFSLPEYEIVRPAYKHNRFLQYLKSIKETFK